MPPGPSKESSGRQGPRTRARQGARCHQQGRSRKAQRARRVRKERVIDRRGPGRPSASRSISGGAGQEERPRQEGTRSEEGRAGAQCAGRRGGDTCGGGGTCGGGARSCGRGRPSRGSGSSHTGQCHQPRTPAPDPTTPGAGTGRDPECTARAASRSAGRQQPLLRRCRCSRAPSGRPTSRFGAGRHAASAGRPTSESGHDAAAADPRFGARSRGRPAEWSGRRSSGRRRAARWSGRRRAPRWCSGRRCSERRTPRWWRRVPRRSRRRRPRRWWWRRRVPQRPRRRTPGWWRRRWPRPWCRHGRRVRTPRCAPGSRAQEQEAAAPGVRQHVGADDRRRAGSAR
jgi:hypothetical protein